MDTDLHHLLRSNQPLTADHCQVQCVCLNKWSETWFTLWHFIILVNFHCHPFYVPFFFLIGISHTLLQLIMWLLIWSVAVFRLSAASRIEVRALGQCLAQRPQAEQSATECQMWSENWGFWPGKDHNWNWLHDGVCCYAVVQSAWTPAELLRVYSSHWYVVGRLYLWWNCYKRASVSWKGLCSSAEANNRGTVAISQSNNLFPSPPFPTISATSLLKSLKLQYSSFSVVYRWHDADESVLLYLNGNVSELFSVMF